MNNGVKNRHDYYNNYCNSSYLKQKQFIMKKKPIIPMLLLFMASCLSGCQVIGDIFKTGVGVGIFIVVFIILIVVFVASKAKKG